ncbi:phosphatase PAP2 family protein [Mesorhizobium sp. ASY16-5R]|uniref:phosphatase PAP2 family protein n=1 Tax=Mesorhizobium sp. ASY16-5R TaxID=3445772 RepID=UPI003FA10A83
MTDVTAVRHPDLAARRPIPHLAIPGWLILASIIAALAMFWLFPALDIATSRVFFVERPCGEFEAATRVCGDFPARLHLAYLRQTLQALPFVLALSLGIWVTLKLTINGRLDSTVARKASTAFWTYAIAVGLVVNVGLKGYSGRPRPIHSDLFGGDLPFVAAGKITGYCASNCSFVSGEMASAVWLLCVVPLLPVAWRTVGFVLAASLATLTGAMRIAFGAHYLSDVVFAAVVTLAVHHLVTAAAGKVHRARPDLGAKILPAISRRTRTRLKQAKE